MTLKDVVAVSGKPGLFKLLKPARSGMIVETFGDNKRFVISASHKVSVLKEISIYVEGADDSIPLQQALEAILAKYPDGVSINTKENNELATFMAEVVPNYDRNRVYPSDMKKLATWYNLLLQYCPEVLVETKEEAQAAAESSEEAQ